MPTTLDWLRSQDDASLITLLSRRPDLAIPAPTDFGTLAARVNQAPSVWRAMEGVSRFDLELITALVLLRADRHEVARDELDAFLGAQVTTEQVTTELTQLRELGLIRGTERLSIAHAVSEPLGPTPAGLGQSTGISADKVHAALEGIAERGRRVLDKLADGPPVGAVDPDGPVAPVVEELVRAALLVRRDSTHVELPREVGLVLRGDRPLGELHPDPVAPPPTVRSVTTVDGTGGGQALDTLRRLRAILDTVTATPPAALRAGGLGVREIRKLLRGIDVADADLNLFFELLAAANLVVMGEHRGQAAAVWTSTVNAESWLASTDEQAWGLIVRHWLDLRRDPTRVGDLGGNGKPIALLSGELGWLRGPAERRWVLQPLVELPPGQGFSPSQLGEVLGWRYPLRDGERRDRVIAAVVREATTLGVLAFDSLTSAGRALLAGADDEVASKLAAALPAPGRTILVQADLTVVAPGRLQADLAEELALAADVESAGSATVYRVTPGSIRRALDRGRGAAELHRLFGDHSATPLPQSLTYLIDDVARRHGVLRAGFAQSYLRCDDPLLIEAAVAALGPAGILLRRLAPTVAITSTDTDELLVALRAAGLVPMAEDEFGAMITLEPRPKRLRSGLVTHQRWREPVPATADQLAVLVQRMRAAEPSDDDRQLSPAETVDVLRQAAGTRMPVWIEYVNAEGSTNRRLVEPVALSGGSVAAWDRLSNQLRTFVLHRISSVVPADRR